MKKLFILAVLILAVVAQAQVPTSQGTPTNLIFSPALPAGTNYSAIFAASGNLKINQLSFLLQNGGLNATNALYWKIQVAIGNTNNFADTAFWYHAGTNYTFDFDTTNLNALAVYVRLAAVNTNASTTIPYVSGTVIHNP